MTTSRLNGTLFCVLFALFVSPTLGFTPTAATKALLDQHPGVQTLVEKDRIVAVYGRAFATDSDPTTDTDTFVRQFLDERGDALGVVNMSVALEGKVDLGDNRHTVYTYTQRIEGLPVFGSLVKIPVLRGATEKISYVGLRLTQPPSQPLPPDVSSAVDALAVIKQTPAYEGLVKFTAPEKVIFPADDGTLHRT